jgi:hypothetical protein
MSTQHRLTALIREMLRVIERLTHKDDGWLDNMRAQVKADEKALLDQLGAKEREL